MIYGKKDHRKKGGIQHTCKTSPSLHTTHSSSSSSIEHSMRRIHRIMDRLSHPFHSRGTLDVSSSTSTSSSSAPSLIAIGYHECI
ncbi:hypothetical protein K492DRAFT_176695 [Lichtheimia hyalospora FSU 10163]|nr:hypothetical protein K492DRAFT_176695 [Lichtheimia hyalospora FSU 10163]